MMLVVLAFIIGKTVSGFQGPTALSHQHGMTRVRVAPEVEAPTFTEDKYPASIEEMIDSYMAWSASKGEPMIYEDARNDVQCFIGNEELAAKWRPVLAKAVEDRRKFNPVQALNTFTAYALPVAVGVTVLPVAHKIGEMIPFVGDVIIPQIDGAIDFIKNGIQKLIQLPLCIEFGDC